MTERKPPHLDWESWIDRQIREAQERGEFNELPGKGKPIADLDEPHDELWWIRQKLRRENVSWLPPTLALRKAVEDTREEIAKQRSEREVRRLVEDLNERIRKVNRQGGEGPASRLMPLDVEAVVAGWRAGATEPGSPTDGQPR